MSCKVLNFSKNQFEKEEICIDRFELLSVAYKCEKESDAWYAMRLASILFHPLDDITFNTLYGITAMAIAKKFDKNEYYYQRLFKEKYCKIRAGEIVAAKTDGKNIPDAWIKRNGVKIPVEVKIYDFDKKALKQLLRYMKAYNCENGIAAARNLSVALPPNIEFISFEELEKVK